MNLKEFLERNKIIKESALAALMWPNKKNQAAVFSNKITGKATGKYQGKQRITEADEERAKVVLLELTDRIKEFAGRKPIEPAKAEEIHVKKEIVKKPATVEPTPAELLRQWVREKNQGLSNQ